MSPEAASSLSQPRRFGSSAGQPLTRRDGLLKVTGRATYAADNHPEGMLYAVTAVSSIARGKVKALDVAAAKSHPGVVEVMTPANRPPLAHDPEEKIPPFGFRVEVLQDDSVRYAKSAHRAGDGRNARSGDGGRGAAEAAIRDRACPGDHGERRPLRTRRRRGRLAGAHRLRRHRSRFRGGLAHHRVRLRDAGAISQRHGAARRRRRVGRRPADVGHAQPGHGAELRVLWRLFRRAGRERADPIALSWRRLRLEGDSERSADPCDPRRADAEAASEARPYPRADVWPGRASRRDVAEVAPWGGRAGTAHRDSPSRRLRDLEFRRVSRAGGERFAAALRQSRDFGRASGQCGSTRGRPDRCARPAKPLARPRSKRRSTRPPRPVAWTHSNSAL